MMSCAPEAGAGDGSPSDGRNSKPERRMSDSNSVPDMVMVAPPFVITDSSVARKRVAARARLQAVRVVLVRK